MVKLGDLYSDFSRIDLDTRGGYARVARVKTKRIKVDTEYCALKLMRHDLELPEGGLHRFEGEIKTLLEITHDVNYPRAITRIHDSGFASVELSRSLQKPRSIIENLDGIELINPEQEILSTGNDLQEFTRLNSYLANRKPGQWLPYIVLELASYEDNLLRQIRQLSSGNTSDLYWLSTREIICMALQILDLIDYLHRKHNVAYMDWKPEHIYWNSLKPQLKVIDWNVTSRFKNDRERKQFIREDVRLFCGAALYCSLALNDPEDLKRPIGPIPKTAPNPIFASPRYWTNKPNFYDRNFILDDKIKLLVQHALDPNKGFDSSLDLKNELIKYAEQELNLSAKDLSPHSISQEKLTEIQELLTDADDAYSRSEYHRSIQLYRRALRIEPNNKTAKARLLNAESEVSRTVDTSKELPREAMQLYRSARSYISARDFQEAIGMLEDAIEIASKKGVGFQEAAQLLAIVKTSIEVEKIRQSIRSALDEEHWDSALDLYKKALVLDPTNMIIHREFNNFRDLISIEEELQKRGIRKVFSRLGPFNDKVATAKDILNPNNRILRSVEKHINQIKLARLGSLIALIIVLLMFFPLLGQANQYSPFPTNSPPVTSSTPTSLEGLKTEISTPTISMTFTIAAPLSPTLTTETLTPTPILVTLGSGYVILGKISAWDKPNGKFVENLRRYQIVTILEKVNDHGANWYRCSWTVSGVLKEGWILAEYIELGAPPTP